jgi:hypothetical protein
LTFNGTNQFTVLAATGTTYNRTESTQYSTFAQHFATNGGTGVEYKTLYRFVDTDNGEIMRLTSSSLYTASGINVAIGTSSADYKLVVADTSDVISAMKNTTSVTSGNRGTLLMYNSTGSNVGRITFAAVTDNVGTEIQFHTRPAAGSLAQTMTLNSVGGLQTLNTIAVGNATPSTSGAGITFPATQSASSNANTLDDYEEGTFTPNQGTGLTVVGTFSSSGKYTKIGNLVTVNFQVNGTTSIACSSAGQISTNLPFSIVATTGNAMGSCMNSSNLNTGAYGYLTEIYSGTTALTASGVIFVTITYLV